MPLVKTPSYRNLNSARNKNDQLDCV